MNLGRLVALEPILEVLENEKSFSKLSLDSQRKTKEKNEHQGNITLWKDSMIFLPFTVSSAECEETPAALVAVLINGTNAFYITRSN